MAPRIGARGAKAATEVSMEAITKLLVDMSLWMRLCEVSTVFHPAPPCLAMSACHKSLHKFISVVVLLS